MARLWTSKVEQLRPRAVLEAQPGQQGQMTAPIPPGNTEAQPGQQAAPHGQALNQQRQATHAEDASRRRKGGGPVSAIQE